MHILHNLKLALRYNLANSLILSHSLLKFRA